MNGLRRFAAAIPLTPFGGLVFAAALALLGTATLSRDRYGLVLAWAALFLLSALALFGRLFASRVKRNPPLLSAAAALYADRPSGLLSVTPCAEPPFFFRIHVVLRGALIVGEREIYTYFRDFGLKHREATVLEAAPPSCGRLSYEGRYTVRDILGLTVCSAEALGGGSAPTRPSFLELPRSILRSASDSRDAKPPLKKTDDEKIFIREYQNGDLARDINWKASGRVRKLLTRIPPTARQESRRLELRVRTDSAETMRGFAAHCHLAALKTIVYQFIAQARLQEPGCAFHVFLNDQERELNADKDLDAFASELADLGFHSTGGPLVSVLPDSSFVFLFSTCLDRQLDEAIGALGARSIQLFLTQPADLSVSEPDFSGRLVGNSRGFRPRPLLFLGKKPERLAVGQAVSGRHEFSVEALWL